MISGLLVRCNGLEQIEWTEIIVRSDFNLLQTGRRYLQDSQENKDECLGDPDS
jgi:hypothetical protein